MPEPAKSGPRTPLPGAPGPGTLSGAWNGTVAATPVLEFGGPPYCFYTVQFTNIASAVQMTVGRVVAADVTATHTEHAIRGCPYTTGPPNTHRYTLNSATIVDRRITIRYDGTTGNYPWAELDFEGEISADGRSIAGVLTWQRVDQPTAPNLQWRMLVELTMRDPAR